MLSVLCIIVGAIIIDMLICLGICVIADTEFLYVAKYFHIGLGYCVLVGIGGYLISYGVSHI